MVINMILVHPCSWHFKDKSVNLPILDTSEKSDIDKGFPPKRSWVCEAGMNGLIMFDPEPR